jgi:G-protein alpha subunit
MMISETKFVIENQKFYFYDVSGKRNQRKYWVPYFDNVHTILFVASLASYDLLLEERPYTNRILDAMSLFKDICHEKLLSGTKKLLFLNKIDLFKKKVPMEFDI